ncbi:uncharacterized protein LOC124415610 [Diprion similis]|uniref:uncharacterized protein LOC124415610 n=1 Tax=Diprion similis TaxID=362088 RepID=UPI001EF98887|nr:uncharacterized protein LOC124415610 [Diprion similis]
MLARALYRRLPLHSASWTVLRSPISALSTVARGGPRVLLRSTILVQDGSLVHELPVMVRRPKDLLLQDEKGERLSSRSNMTKKSKSEGRRGPSRRINIETDEGTAILFGSDLDFLKEANVEQLLAGLESCYTPKGVFSLLETIIVEEINSMVAVQALRKIIELENSPRNGSRASPTCNRECVLGQVVEMIAGTQDGDTLLEALDLLARDTISPPVNRLRDRLCDEVASRIADNEMSVAQIVEAVRVMTKFRNLEYQEVVDSLWVGLAARESEVSAEDLVPLFRSLHSFKKSRRFVHAVLDRRLERHLRLLTGRQIADILNALANAAIESPETLRLANKWAATKANTVNEQDLLDLVRTWTVTRNVDPAVEKMMETHFETRLGKAKAKEVQPSSMHEYFRSACSVLLGSWVRWFRI